MSEQNPADDAEASRTEEASDWFARMRGPEAFASRAAFGAWLADPANARAYREIERIWAMAGMAEVPAKGHAKRRYTRASWQSYALAASIALGAIMLALLLIANRPSRPSGGSAIAYSSQVGEIRQITLADGSRVTLDTASRLAVDYTARERRVMLLAGRARFDVAHDLARPFVVVAGERAVVAHGTVFDVRLEGGSMDVTLLKGRIEVERLRGEAPAQSIARLAPGQRLTLRKFDRSARPEPASREEAVWTQGLLPADALPLADLVAEANRYSPRKIVLADPDLGALRVTGAFRPGDSAALAAHLAAALGLVATTRPDGSVLIAARPD